MNRRDWLKATAGAAAAMAGNPQRSAPAVAAGNPQRNAPAVAAGEAQPQGPRRRRPNFLFLFADDQRFDTLHALGNPEIRTPNLDRLVRRGVAFTNAFIMGGTVPAVCVPSRAMLLSGQSLFHAHNRIIAPPKGPEADNPPVALFPETLRQAGYTTFATGKWHNGPRLHARCFASAENIFFGGMSDQSKVPVQDFDPSGRYEKARQHTGGKFSSELFTDSAIGFLRNHRGGNPFLLYVAYTAPHDPRTPPQQYLDMYPPEKVRLPQNFLPEHPFDNGELKVRDEQLAPWPRTPAVIRGHIAAYYGMITHMDAQIGRVLKALEESGHADNTVIVFAADNGLAVGSHGLMGKQNVYEHSVRVPLVIGGAGLPRGQRRDQFCYLLDLFPTLCDLAGVAAPASIEGINLAPVLRGARASTRDSVFFAYRDFQRAVRTPDWKLIRYNVAGRQTTQLFDIRNDPFETRSLAADPAHAGRVKELNALLKDWMRRTEDPSGNAE